MLRVSKLADYGTIIMASMARDPHGIHSAADVATRIGLGAPTVSKILKMLARKDLVVSQRGARGGYRLRCPPADISVAQIIGAMDGPIGMTECSTTPGLCVQESDCTIRANWQTINRIVLEALQRVTLEQLSQPVAQKVPVIAITRKPARAAV
jgi:FeS assembly SUF system regulator